MITFSSSFSSFTFAAASAASASFSSFSSFCSAVNPAVSSPSGCVFSFKASITSP
jgi:hypothetical protein